MGININSTKAKLLNISKEKNIDFQVMLNRFGSEQFLARLSKSDLVEKFIFKGGSLLTYLIETSRKTRDIDFSIKQINNQLDDLIEALKNILNINLDDGIEWEQPRGEQLNHPDMPEPGARINCHFLLGKMHGQIQMDLAFGDHVNPVYIILPRLHYRGLPLIGGDISVLSYPPESVFAEKLHIIVSKKENNTRMKDYYDLFKLCQTSLDALKLKNSIETTFKNRSYVLAIDIAFDDQIIAGIQARWLSFITKEKLDDAPKNVSDVINAVNKVLKTIF